MASNILVVITKLNQKALHTLAHQSNFKSTFCAGIFDVMLIIEESICEFRSPSCHICHIYRFCPILLKSDFQKCSLPQLVGCLSRGIEGTSSKQLRKLIFVKPYRRKVLKPHFKTGIFKTEIKHCFELVAPIPLDRHPTSQGDKHF